MLLHDLTIEHFRSFEKYKLDKLARVNLLVGDNNCGKTSVLESVRLLVARGKISTILHMLEIREDFDQVVIGTGTPEEYQTRFDGSSLFTNGMTAHNFDEFSKISISSSVGSPLQIILEVRAPQNGRPAELITRFSSGSDMDTVESIVMYPGGLLSRPWNQWPVEWKSSNEQSQGPFFLSALKQSTLQIATMWETVIKERREGYVVEALKVINESYLNVVFSPRTETLRDIHVDFGTERLSMSVLGAGAELLLRIGIALAHSKSGIVLIDEIDTGLHYSRLADMWKMVITAAQKLDVQVFATTHSLDCIRGLAEAVRNDESFVEKVAIFKIDRRTDHAVRYGGDELEIIVDHEIEVRG